MVGSLPVTQRTQERRVLVEETRLKNTATVCQQGATPPPAGLSSASKRRDTLLHGDLHPSSAFISNHHFAQLNCRLSSLRKSESSLGRRCIGPLQGAGNQRVFSPPTPVLVALPSPNCRCVRGLIAFPHFNPRAHLCGLGVSAPRPRRPPKVWSPSWQ